MQPTAEGGGDSHPLGEFLEEARDQILADWERAVRSRRGRRATPQIRAHVAELLDRLAAVVRRGAAGREAVGALPDLRALGRTGARFDIRAAARELSLLRTVVLRRWQALFGERIPSAALAEVRRFDAAIDEVIARSLAAREPPQEPEAEPATDRRERELARLFEISPDLLAVVGTDGFLKRVNPAFRAVTGYSDAELLSRPYLELVHPDDREATRAAVERVLSGERAARFALRAVRRDGQTRWLSFNAAADPGAHVFVAVGRDVTEERHRAEFEQQLIGIVSHDLRNPLSAIVTALATLLLRHQDLDERTLKSLSHIQSAADRAMALIRDLLDFTKARTPGGIAIAPQRMDLHVHARAAATEASSAFPGRQVRFEQSGNCEGVWDPDRVGQVVGNLVSNACKYGSKDAPVVLRTRGCDRWVEIEVHNEGDPIDPALLPHIFEPLRQARRTGGVGGVSGVGLGLYIVDHVVRAHGGTVDVTSRAGEGTTFRVRLPRQAPSQG